MSWWFRRTRKWGPWRGTYSHSRNGPRATGSLRIWPLSINTRGRVTVSAFGFNKILRKGDR